MNPTTTVRDELLKQLRVSHSHVSIWHLLDGIPWDRAGEEVPGFDREDHTIWTLLVHIRICMDDIIDYVENPAYVHPDFPGGLWPAEHAPADAATWQGEIDRLKKSYAAVEEWIQNRDLMTPFNKAGHTLLRQILIIIRHNSYHTAQIFDAAQAIGLRLRDY
mgnify:FL=1